MTSAAAAGDPAPSQRGHDNTGRTVGMVVGVIIAIALGIVAIDIVEGWMNEASNDSIYLAKMHASPYGAHSNTDAELIAIAHNVCGAFDYGKTVKQIVYSFYGMSVQQEEYLMDAAVSVYCRAHRDTMIGEFNAYDGY